MIKQSSILLYTQNGSQGMARLCKFRLFSSQKHLWRFCSFQYWGSKLQHTYIHRPT